MRASRSPQSPPARPSSAGRGRIPQAALCALVASVVALAIVPAGAGAASPDGSRRSPASLSLASRTSVTSVALGSADASRPVLRPMVAPRKPAPAPASVKKPRRAVSRSSRSGKRRGWSTALVSWYGPGFYGHTMAGGGTLRRDSMVVAHRSMPFGTRIQFSYRGRTCTAVVRDRGPYAGRRVFDLGPGTARALRFSGVGKVRYRILGR